MKKIRKAVIPVAGLGTRNLPATKAIPKEMLTVIDKPMIQYVVEEAFASGIEHIVFVTGRGKEEIANHFDAAPLLEQALEKSGKDGLLNAVRACSFPPQQISYVRQDRPLGLGHAVYCAKAVIGDEPFAVMLPDDLIVGEVPCLKQLIEVYEQTGANVISTIRVPKDQVNRYGIFDVENSDGRLHKTRRIVEKPDIDKAPSDISVVGRYVLNPVVFDCMDMDARTKGEIQLTDAIDRAIKSVDLYGFDFIGKRYDCGNKLGYLEAIVELALRRSDTRDFVKEVIARNV